MGLEDRWSDIDLALGLIAGADFDRVVADWTARLYRDHAAVANYEAWQHPVSRVSPREHSQVDLSFWPFGELRAMVRNSL